MSTIRVGDNENLENALRRFKRKCSRDGIIGDLRKKEFYEKPSVKKRKKAEAALAKNVETKRILGKRGENYGADVEIACKRSQGAHEEGVLETVRGGT